MYKVLALVMLFVGGIAAYTFVCDLGDVGIGLMSIFNTGILYLMGGCLLYTSDTQLKKEELDQTLISGCRIFHFGSLSLTDEPAESTTIEAVKMAKAAGALISYDPNYRPSLWKSKEDAVKKMRSVIELVDVMKVSDEESTLLTEAKSYEQAADQLLAMGPKLVAITLGE